MGNSIKITGSYGDEVKLHPDGYITTKNGDIFKIKSIDIDKQIVECYGGSKHFSYISQSTKKSQDSDNYYLTELKDYFDRMGIKTGSIIDYKHIQDNFGVKSLKVLDIIYPTLQGDDYLPRLKVENTETYSTYIVSIENFNTFENMEMLKVHFTPYTLEEKLKNLLDNSMDIDGNIEDEETYIKYLLKIFNEELENRTIIDKSII
jgi:hypothetical protein